MFCNESSMEWREFAKIAKLASLTVVLLASSILLSGCSRLTLFVVVNRSDQLFWSATEGNQRPKDTYHVLDLPSSWNRNWKRIKDGRNCPHHNLNSTLRLAS